MTTPPLLPKDESLHRTPVQDFVDLFDPAEYDSYGQGWDAVADHPNFNAVNPFNPNRVHEGTWGDFLDDVARNGITEPVSVDHWSQQVSEGHHRVVAAMLTDRDVPWHWEHTLACSHVHPREGQTKDRTTP